MTANHDVKLQVNSAHRPVDRAWDNGCCSHDCRSRAIVRLYSGYLVIFPSHVIPAMKGALFFLMNRYIRLMCLVMRSAMSKAEMFLARMTSRQALA